MNTPTKITTFIAGLAAVFGVAAGAGHAVGPLHAATPAAHGDAHGGSAMNDTHGHDMKGMEGMATHLPGGLMVSQDGYTLNLLDPTRGAGASVPVKFTITGPDGRPVTDYAKTHEKSLHLIAVRRDLTGYQHVHPSLDPATGVWTTPLELTGGQWRLFADFAAAGADPLTLGTDLAVPGQYKPASAATPSKKAQVDDYTVTLDGELAAGGEAELKLRVSKNGKPVTDLQPYLGAYGHLVALREGDLAYLHVHPDGSPGDGSTRPGPEVDFFATVPSNGSYRLFFDFKHRGVVHTASFPVTTQGSPGTGVAGAPTDDSTGGPTGSHGEHSH